MFNKVFSHNAYLKSYITYSLLKRFHKHISLVSSPNWSLVFFTWSLIICFESLLDQISILNLKSVIFGEFLKSYYYYYFCFKMRFGKIRLKKCKLKRISNFQNSLYCLGGDNSDSYNNSRHSALDSFPMVLEICFC